MLPVRQTQKSLVDERRRVERPRLSFPTQVSRRQFFQFVVHQRNHRVQGLLIAAMNPLEELRDLHGRLAYYSTADGGVEDSADSHLENVSRPVAEAVRWLESTVAVVENRLAPGHPSLTYYSFALRAT
jgi:hypothetical protein